VDDSPTGGGIQPLRPDDPDEPQRPASEIPPTEGDATVGEILRWVLEETEAEAAIYLRLSPGGDERFMVEPRALPASDVTYMARHARDVIIKGDIDPEVNEPTAHARWLGKSGSKIILLRGTTQADAAEALRFARFVIEWLSAPRGESGPALEQRVRQVEGVAWAELLEGDPPTLRLLYGPEADHSATRSSVARAVGPVPVHIEEIDPTAQPEEPRLRLVDLSVEGETETAVDVLLDWKGQTLRGRGLGRPTTAGRSYASALAVVDAMKPLIEMEVEVEGLYRTDAAGDLDVLVVAVRVAGQRYVGAVAAMKGEEDVSAARAVLDALNRRLPQIAGRSGRI
jgi:hypothetical protein